MKKIFWILLITVLICPLPSFSEEIEIDSSILTVNRDNDFFIIRSGEDAGIEIGDGLIVHRGGEKIAEAYIIETRPDVAAAEILSLEDNEQIQEGDEILIVKKTGPDSEREDIAPERPRSKWANLLGMESTTPEAPFVKTFSREEMQDVSVSGISEGEFLSIDIDKDKNAVFSYADTVLRENGFSIVLSNRVNGLILASRPIGLPILKELWADATAAIGHNLVISLDIKDNGGLSELRMLSFREHFQKGKYIKQPVSQDSRYYSEAIEVISKIKERAEYY